jgi:hypothetical protein
VKLVATAVLAVLLAGCGSESADLFEVQRSGGGQSFDLVVNDGGTATCDRGKSKALPGNKLLDARELARQLEKQAKLSIELPKGKGSVLHYVVRTSEGRVSFYDTSPDPRAVGEVQLAQGAAKEPEQLGQAGGLGALLQQLLLGGVRELDRPGHLVGAHPGDLADVGHAVRGALDEVGVGLVDLGEEVSVRVGGGVVEEEGDRPARSPGGTAASRARRG